VAKVQSLEDFLKEALFKVGTVGVTGRIQFSNDGARLGPAKIIKSRGCSEK
jgi:hypothetical protein